MDVAMTYTTTDAPVRGGALRVGRWQPDDGAAPGVLLVHGVTASHQAWASLADHAADLDLVAPDLRGRGRSSDVPGPAGLEQHADDLARVLDHLGLASVVVAGHSMGGLVSVLLADRHPDRVRSLVLVDGGLPLHPLPGMTPEQTMEVTLGPATARLRIAFPTRAAYQDFWAAHPAFARGIDERMAAYFDYDLVDAPDGFRSCVSADLVRDDVLSQLDPDVLTPALERLRVPATFLRAPRGLLDQPEPLYPAEEAQRWAASLPLLDVVDVDDVNHYTILFDEAPLLRIADLLRSATTTEENP